MNPFLRSAALRFTALSVAMLPAACGPAIPHIEAPAEEPPIFDATASGGNLSRRAPPEEVEEEPSEPPIVLGDSSGELHVVVLPSGVRVGRQEMSDDALAARVTNTSPSPSVLLEASDDTPYARVVALMDRLRAAGATQMALVTGDQGSRAGTSLSASLRAAHQRCRDTGREQGHDMDMYELTSTLEEPERSRLTYEAAEDSQLRCLVPAEGTVSIVAEHGE